MPLGRFRASPVNALQEPGKGKSASEAVYDGAPTVQITLGVVSAARQGNGGGDMETEASSVD